MVKLTLILISIVLLSACAKPPLSEAKLKGYLSAECYDAMTKPGVANYRYHATHVIAYGYFALASDGKDKQACGWVTSGEALGREQTSKVVALARCEEERRRRGIAASCRIFAKNFDIVYDQETNHEME
jgi:hypothetical protein